MGEQPKGPPPLYNWFKVPFAYYDEARRDEETHARKWWANERRREAFARAQGGGN